MQIFRNIFLNLYKKTNIDWHILFFYSALAILMKDKQHLILLFLYIIFKLLNSQNTFNSKQLKLGLDSFYKISPFPENLYQIYEYYIILEFRVNIPIYKKDNETVFFFYPIKYQFCFYIPRLNITFIFRFKHNTRMLKDHNAYMLKINNLNIFYYHYLCTHVSLSIF